jgi:hypothetical protein
VASGKARFRPCRVSSAAAIPLQPRSVGAAPGSWPGLQGRTSRRHLWGCCVSRTRDPVAGRLAFPALPHDLRAVAGPGPPGYSRHARHLPPKRRIDGLHDLCLFFEALAKAPEPPCVGPSSHGIRVSPSRRHTSCASTPRSRGSLRTDAARRRFTFRPRGFAPPRRFAPHWSYGSVAPRNRPRVRRVSCVPPPRDARRRRGSSGCSPRDAVHTL